MSGAYVAKPAVAVDPPEGPPTVDDVPEGWDLDWPFCGTSGHDPDPFFPAPHPPGYTSDYSLVMTATDSIGYSGAAAVVSSLRDHLTYATNEPTPVIWTATVASSPSRSINLRFSGDGEYASSISSDCAFATYWGVTPDIEFELEEDDEGGTVTLIGTSSVGGIVVSEEVDIEVYELSLDMSVAETMQYDGTLAVEVDLRDGESSKTEEPIGSTLLWSATINDVAVGLRFSGDTEYSSSIESVYSDLTDFWGAEKDIEFNLTEGNDMDTVVLRVVSTAFGVGLVDMVNVVITVPPHEYTCEFQMNAIAISGPSATIHDNLIAWGVGEAEVSYHWMFGWQEIISNPEYWSALNGVISSIYGIGGAERYMEVCEIPAGDVIYTFRTYDRGVLQNTYSTQPAPAVFAEYIWLSWNETTGEVTIINP